MHLEVLAEDKSGSIFLDSLLGKIIDDSKFDCTLAVRPHRGKGFYPPNPRDNPKKFASGLLDLLPAKLRAYTQVCDPAKTILIVVMDADEDDPGAARKQLRETFIRFGGDLPFVIGISVEEIEAWMLGDLPAVQKAYPHARPGLAESYVQDSVCGTWEVLAEVILGNAAKRLIRVGYPAIGQYKSEWAARIAPHMNPEQNKSPSFQEFYRNLIQMLQRQMSMDRNNNQ